MGLPSHPLDRCGPCERIPRSQIQEASYNPRTITPDQKRRLKKVLEKHGLCTPLVWNKRNQVLVGGHQRLSVLDTLTPEKEWAVPVTVVDLDEQAERELNVALNNSEASGMFDYGKLGEMFKGFKLDVEATGFDPGKLKTILPDIAVTIPEVSAQLQQNKQHWQDEKKKTEAKVEAAYDRIAAKAAEFTPAISAPVEKPADRHEQAIYETDDLFYIPFVFPDMFVAAKCKEMMGLPVESRDQDGRVLMQIITEWAGLKNAKR